MTGIALDYNSQTDTTEVLVNEEDVIEVKGSYSYGEKVRISESDIVSSFFSKDGEEIIPWYDRDY